MKLNINLNYEKMCSRHDIAEILLKLTLNTNQSINQQKLMSQISVYITMLIINFLIGWSLFWVAVLGLIVIYIYALIGFSLLRAFFNPAKYLYCHTLWQCTITVIRYGLIGDMFEVS